AYRPRAPFCIDRINCLHELLRTLPVVLVKKMRLDLMCGYERRQDDASFLIPIAFTKELLDTSESIPNQLGCILGGYGKGHGYAIGVLGFIYKAIRHKKDRQYPSSHMVPT